MFGTDKKEELSQHNEHRDRQDSLDKNPSTPELTNPHTERAVALAMARAADPGPKAFSARSFHLLFIVLVVCMCSGDNGFDGTVMGGINSMLQFQRFFGLEKAASSTGIIFVSTPVPSVTNHQGMYTVGQVCSAFFTIWLPDKLGRRYGMLIGNLLLVYVNERTAGVCEAR